MCLMDHGFREEKDTCYSYKRDIFDLFDSSSDNFFIILSVPGSMPSMAVYLTGVVI